MRRILVPFILFAGFLAIPLNGCNNAEETETSAQEEALVVDTIGAQRGSLVISETYMGTVSASKELKVYPKTSGEVIKINVKAGDFVNAGDVLFQLNDEFAQLDLKSAQTSLSKTQAEVRKSQGSDEVLSQQKEWQELENKTGKIADGNYGLNTAKEDYNRQIQYLGEAHEREDGAYDDYKRAERKYDKAKSILKDYEDLKEEEPAFANSPLDVAAGMEPGDPNPTREHIDRAKELWERAYDSDKGRLYASDITPEGVATLRNARESLYSKYEELKMSRESQEDKVTAAKRNVDKADKGLQDEYVSYRQDVDNMLVRDNSQLEDAKRINQIAINSSAIGVERAEQTLEQYTVTAPISGIVGKVAIKEYEIVSTGTEAVLIEDKDNMKVEFSVTEKVRSNLTEGQPIRIEKDDIKVTGQIFEIADVANEQTGLFMVKAYIPGTSGIMSGTTVTVAVDSYMDDSGFVIPNDAVYHSNGQSYVYVVQNGVAARRDVVTGLFDLDRIVIIEGLNDGDRIITSWTSDLNEGDRIKENPVNTPSVSIDTKTSEGGDSAPVIATEPSEDLTIETEDTPTPQKVRATTTVFIRSTPDSSGDSNKLAKAKEGDEFEFLSDENGWTKVDYNGTEAYIKSDYLTETEGGE